MCLPDRSSHRRSRSHGNLFIIHKWNGYLFSIVSFDTIYHIYYLGRPSYCHHSPCYFYCHCHGRFKSIASIQILGYAAAVLFRRLSFQFIFHSFYSLHQTAPATNNITSNNNNHFLLLRIIFPPLFILWSFACYIHSFIWTVNSGSTATSSSSSTTTSTAPVSTATAPATTATAPSTTVAVSYQ